MRNRLMLVVFVFALWTACTQPATVQQRQPGTFTEGLQKATKEGTAKIFEIPPPATPGLGQTVDINTASLDQLRKMPFIGDSYALKIIQGRPYKRKDELSSRNILPPHVYNKAKDYLIASGSR
jgi:DNA uptake protein ComE-like DNA-binding protein